MAVKAISYRGTAVIFAGVLLLAFWVSGCKRGVGDAEGILVSTRIPLASYVHTAFRANTGKEAQLYFPQLAIYDESGALLYSSHDVNENARILKELPDGIRALQPKPGTAGLAETIKEMPDFQARKTEILGSRKVSVLSTFLEDCHACSFQEEALDGAKDQLLNHGINLLVVHLTKPK